MNKHLLRRATLAALLTTLAVAPFSARAEEEFKERPQKPLEPATRYSGRTPIDLKNGIPFNNGTYGLRNATYEKWADEPVVFPGISTLNYPYAEKAELIVSLEERAQFFEDAITNWKVQTEITKPEAKAYGEASIQAMQPLVEKFRASIKQASSSNSSDWEKNQADARRELGNVYGTYQSFHKNVH